MTIEMCRSQILIEWGCLNICIRVCDFDLHVAWKSILIMLRHGDIKFLWLLTCWIQKHLCQIVFRIILYNYSQLLVVQIFVIYAVGHAILCKDNTLMFFQRRKNPDIIVYFVRLLITCCSLVWIVTRILLLQAMLKSLKVSWIFK